MRWFLSRENVFFLLSSEFHVRAHRFAISMYDYAKQVMGNDGARVQEHRSLCFIVSPDRVNWFMYDFEEDNELFKDEKFVQTFKK